MHQTGTLLNAYKTKKSLIKRRLREFDKVRRGKDNRAIFEEICFCILTANASARMGINAIAKIRERLFTADTEELSRLLKGAHRFYNTRAKYILETRSFLLAACNLNMVRLIESFNDSMELRGFFAKNKNIKGLGFKEASHFLRNIGFKGYAILDKHILKTMSEFGIIDELPKNMNEKKYLELELKLKAFADKIGIDFDELDLLLWSEKTGEILK